MLLPQTNLEQVPKHLTALKVTIYKTTRRTPWWRPSNINNNNKNIHSKWIKVYKWIRWIKWTQFYSNNKWFTICSIDSPTLITSRGPTNSQRRTTRRMRTSRRRTRLRLMQMLSQMRHSWSHSWNSSCSNTRRHMVVEKRLMMKPRSKNFIWNWELWYRI